MKRLISVFLVLCISTYSLYSQNKTINGKVISDDLEYLPRAFIMINDSIEVGKTDLKGYFKVDVPANVKKIKFMYVGLYPATIELVDECDKIEVVMIRSSTNDFISLKKAERRRRKKYKKLPKIHKQAFEKGIFDTEKPCYKRKYEPFYLDSD